MDKEMVEEGEKKVKMGEKRVVGGGKVVFQGGTGLSMVWVFIHFVALREFHFSDICVNVFMIEDKMEDPRRWWVDHITAQSGLALCTLKSTQPLSSLSLLILFIVLGDISAQMAQPCITANVIFNKFSEELREKRWDKGVMFQLDQRTVT